jgi:hypothetical protein
MVGKRIDQQIWNERTTKFKIFGAYFCRVFLFVRYFHKSKGKLNFIQTNNFVEVVNVFDFLKKNICVH